MDKDNSDLENLTKNSIDLEPIRLSRNEIDSFVKIRDHLASLHDTLALGSWACNCAVPHRANLRLEARSNTAKAAKMASKDIKFGVVFSFETTTASTGLPWNWRETEIVPSENTEDDDGDPNAADKPTTEQNGSITPAKSAETDGGALRPRVSPPNKPPEKHRGSDDNHLRPSARPSPGRKGVSFAADTRPGDHAIRKTVSENNLIMSSTRISNLCYTFQQAKDTNACLGFLVDKRWRHHIYSISRPIAAPRQESITLKDILCRSKRAELDALELTNRDKLQLAYTLASTVLQLQSTPWLDRQWGLQDILIVPGTGTSLAEQAYVAKSFLSCTQKQLLHPLRPHSHNPFIQNETIFALGVVLLELSFGRPLRDYGDEEELKNPDYADALIARRLGIQVARREGDRYGDAVRRCVEGKFDVREADLGNKDYRQAVFQKVVKPLEGIWNDFNKSW